MLISSASVSKPLKTSTCKRIILSVCLYICVCSSTDHLRCNVDHTVTSVASKSGRECGCVTLAYNGIGRREMSVGCLNQFSLRQRVNMTASAVPLTDTVYLFICLACALSHGLVGEKSRGRGHVHRNLHRCRLNIILEG